MRSLAGGKAKLRTAPFAVAGVVVVAVTLFRVPLATIFTLGLLLICPLLMVGMHGGRHQAEHTTLDEIQADQSDRAGDEGSRVRTAPVSPLEDRGPGRSPNDQRGGVGS